IRRRHDRAPSRPRGRAIVRPPWAVWPQASASGEKNPPGVSGSRPSDSVNRAKGMSRTTGLQGGSRVMLVLTRRIGEEMLIGGEVGVTVVAVKGKQVRLGVTAPPSVPVARLELLAERSEGAEQQPPPSMSLTE